VFEMPALGWRGKRERIVPVPYGLKEVSLTGGKEGSYRMLSRWEEGR